MAIPRFLQSCLWSYDLKKIDPSKDKNVIIIQVLNHGNWEQIKWLCKTYTKAEIREIVKSPARGMWHKSILRYWCDVLNVRIASKKKTAAIWR